ncbi:metalloendopeptidase [Saccharomycopsis crataegensis]|uniref:Metalloendopeptidase n=1 Tax=Saccharomycopsis crataegensis TaxID=43959 RepID=A0AAV5QUP5_9ASCO|nr:metalloendopeptidase [Saccharomycopsis crataegensis]
MPSSQRSSLIYRLSLVPGIFIFLWICWALYSSDLQYQNSIKGTAGFNNDIMSAKLGKTVHYYKSILAGPKYSSWSLFSVSNTRCSENLGLFSSYSVRFFGSNSQNLVPPQQPPSWNDTPEQILEKTKRFLEKVKEQDDSIAALSEPTLENLIIPYSQWENERFRMINYLTLYQHVSTNPEIRNASTEAEKLLDKQAIESGLREDIFKNVKKVYEDNKDNDSLAPELKRFISKLYNAYRRNGLDLPKETREKVEKVSKKLSELSIQFNQNLGEQTEFLLLTKEELEGVPEDVLSQFDKQDDKYKVTFKYPDIVPTLKYSKNAATRKKAFIGDQNKVPENAEILKEAIKIRLELAQLLGYKSYAEYILELSMAKTADRVMEFENDLWDKLKPKAAEELSKMKQLKLQDYKERGLNIESEEAKNYYIWDHGYYNNKLLQEQYKVDEQKISEYFPLQSTVEKMLKFYETLFNLKFEEVTDPKQKSVWHEDVKQRSVWKMDDLKNPEFLGWIYFDLHPRDGKYGHAAEFEIWPGYFDETTGKKSRPVCALICNFSKPSKTKPSLLKHNEVTTFFHELGHGIHEIVGDTHYARFHGTATARDFVEAPSQMLEFWTWTSAELKKLSSHYITGDPLPESLIASLVKSKHVNGGLGNLRQLHFGLFDMTIHNTHDGKADVDKAWNSLREEVTLLKSGDENVRGYGSFGHMMGGYAAGYYGYLYSEVFATDMYYTLFKEDPMNTTNGIRYRDTILKRGGSRDDLDNLKELLGREPNSDAFLQEIGINK